MSGYGLCHRRESVAWGKILQLLYFVGVLAARICRELLPPEKKDRKVGTKWQKNHCSAVTSAFFSCATSTEARVAVDRGEDRGVQMGSGSGVMTALVLGA